jgi:hypothetical protein
MNRQLLPTVLELHRHILPPTRPWHGGTDGEWAELFQRLGRSLPLEYQQLMQTYGYGQFENEFSFFQPFVGDIEIDGQSTPSLTYYNLNYQEVMLKTDSQPVTYCSDWLVDTDGNKLQQLAVWPDDNSIFCLFHHSNGFDLAYRAKGHPDSWTILVSVAAHAFVEFPMTLAEFLLSRIRSESDGVVQLFSTRNKSTASYRFSAAGVEN